MAVEQDGFNASEQAVVAVQVGPARLNHADIRFGEVVNDFHEPVGRRHEIGIKDRNEFVPRRHSGLRRALRP